MLKQFNLLTFKLNFNLFIDIALQSTVFSNKPKISFIS